MTAAAGRQPGAAGTIAWAASRAGVPLPVRVRTAIVGVQRARMWRLYLAGGALAFEEGRMGVDQILAVRRGG